MIWQPYWQIIRGDKPIGFFLLLWPALWGILFASPQLPPLRLWLIFIAGSFIMRAAGCVINDLWDYPLDRHVARTTSRPLSRGALSPRHAGLIAFTLLCLALILALMLPPLCWVIALISFFGILAYPSLKRFTHYPQVLLGFLFAGAPVLLGFAARSHFFSWDAWITCMIVSLWPIAYDTVYALQDKRDDEKLKLYSLAIRLGNSVWSVTLLLQLLFLSGWIYLGQRFNLHPIYYAGALGALGITFLQWHMLKRPQPAYWKIFSLNVILGAVLFLGLIGSRLI